MPHDWQDYEDEMRRLDERMRSRITSQHWLGGIAVVETPFLAFDEMIVDRPNGFLMVGEYAHLKWRLWLGKQRREALSAVDAMIADLAKSLGVDDQLATE